MRRTLRCTTPASTPRIIDAAASTHSTGAHSAWRPPNADMNTRTNAANAAAFTPVDMNAVTAGGAPSYASGVHMWNGTADTLNANPTRISPTARNCIGVGEVAWDAMRPPMRSSRVLPVSPYMNAMP